MGSEPPERERPSRPGPDLLAALSSVKKLVSIVMGLALTNAIITVVTDQTTEERIHGSKASLDLLPLSQISPESALCAIALVTAIVRFYHGNGQLLELLYGEGSRKEQNGPLSGGIGGNFIVIMVQSVLFALMSFYVNGNRSLILLFGLLLVIDIFWYVANLTTTDTDPEALGQQQRWMFNNFGFLAVLVGLYYANNNGWAVTAAAVAILLNTLVDFYISWNFYFPGHTRVD